AAGTLMVVCFVHVLPNVSDMVDCVEQAVEPETRVCTETTNKLFTVMALPVTTEAVEHGDAVQELPPVCAIAGAANTGIALIGSDTRAASTNKQPDKSPLL